jgi:hypothetical protein
MRKSLVIVPLVAAAAVLGTLPASAQTTGDTPITFQVTGGTLDITVPSGPVNLGTVAAGDTAQTVSAKLGTVTVTDGRDGTTGWTVTEHGVDFTGPSTISVSAPGSSSYDPGVITTTGTVIATGTAQSPIYPPSAVVTGTGVNGINTATWDPTVSITVPANTLTGTYSSTITHDIA